MPFKNNVEDDTKKNGYACINNKISDHDLQLILSVVFLAMNFIFM